MRKLLLTLVGILCLTACTQTTAPTTEVQFSSGDLLITKEYIDENIDNFYLDFSGMGLTHIPDFSEIITEVQRENILYLNLSNNQITEISDDLLALPNLKELKLDNNQIKKLENIADIALLNRLEVYKNQIEEIDLGDLPTLVVLDLSYNNLDTEDFQSLIHLTALQNLQLQHNQITSIDGIQALGNLKELKLEYNQISEVSILDQLENLASVTLAKNALPEEVVEKWKKFNEENK